jgi:hypothetical protein
VTCRPRRLCCCPRRAVDCTLLRRGRSIASVHEDCLVRWLKHSGNKECELCGETFRCVRHGASLLFRTALTAWRGSFGCARDQVRADLCSKYPTPSDYA